MQKFSKVLTLMVAMLALAFCAMSCKVNVVDGNPTMYTVTVDSSIEHGKVSVDKTSAEAETTITLTATADEGYELDSYSVKDESSNDITVTDGTFVMPKSNVTVSATFKKTEATLNQEAADPVITKINAIGEVTYTDDCKAKIDEARTAYDALTSDQKALVTNYSTLTTAESSYESLTPIPVTAITLNKTATTISAGQTETLSVSSVTPDDATDKTVTWSSDNETVATVNATTGEVTAVALGTANITATANDGSDVTATCTVKVSTLAAAFVDGATIKVNFKWREYNSGDYVQGTYNADSGTFTVSKGGSDWGRDNRAVYKVEKSGDNIIIGAGFYDYTFESMVWTFNTTNDTYTTTNGDMVNNFPGEYGLISVTLNGTDITSQLTKQ